MEYRVIMDQSPSSSPESGDNSDEVSSGHFLEEENLIDSLFYTCDANQTGRVRVSSILDYLRCITDSADVSVYSQLFSLFCFSFINYMACLSL